MYDFNVERALSKIPSFLAVHKWIVGDNQNNCIEVLTSQIKNLGVSEASIVLTMLQHKNFLPSTMHFLRALVIRHTSNQTYQATGMKLLESAEKVRHSYRFLPNYYIFQVDSLRLTFLLLRILLTKTERWIEPKEFFATSAEADSPVLRRVTLSRIWWILKDIESHRGIKKIVVASICSKSLEHLYKLLSEKKLEVATISLKLPERKLRDLVSDFEESKTSMVMLINPKDIPDNLCLNSTNYLYLLDGVSNVQLEDAVLDSVLVGAAGKKKASLEVIRFRHDGFHDKQDPFLSGATFESDEVVL